MKLDPEIQALLDKVGLGTPTGGKPKKKAAADPLTEAVKKTVKEVKAKEKEKRGYFNGAGYEYVKVWDEKGIGYRMVPRARVEMAKIIGRPLTQDERVYFVSRKRRGDALYAPDNLLYGDTQGIDLSKLSCSECGAVGHWKSTYDVDGEEGNTE